MLTLEHYTKTHHRDTYDALNETKAEHSCLGKSVFITGAGTGIGKAIALAFCRASAHAIFLTGRTKATLEETQREIRQLRSDCITECYSMDVTNEAQVSDAFDQAHKRIGRPIDILISNAGYVAYVEKTTDASFDKIWSHFEINVKGSMLVMLSFVKHATEKGATIVNVSSGAAVVNFADGLSAYSASKVATMKLVDYINREEVQRDLRLFNIHPGVVPTAMAAEGKQNMVDTAELPGSYAVWLSTPDADFLKGRFMYANWDIDELKAMKDKIVDQNLLTLTLKGMDSTEWLA